MINLPEKFKERMISQLGDGFEEFLSTYERPPYKAIRVNSLKISKDEFLKISPFELKEVAWEQNGFYVEEEKVGSHPYHFAGLYYSQEPSAMSAAPLLEVKKGERVLDLCSAPGGKGTKLCEMTGGEGIVVLNEYVPSRAKILSQNVERMGVRNAVVLNETPERLAERFGSYFDKILVDAPCSGEGMFKKNEEEAISNWSEENVMACARRQRDILNSAKLMLKRGGRLLYSTCTFSLEEDEWQIRDFLNENKDFSLIKEDKIYPHKVKGEGHYIALLQKNGGEERDLKPIKSNILKNEEQLYRQFEEKLLSVKFDNLYKVKDAIYSLPQNAFDFKGLNVLRAGVRLCEVVNGRIEPAHSLAACLKREEIKNYVSLSKDECVKYLKGETFSYNIKDGWCVVGVENYPLGMGKATKNLVKNHYPKGLRMMGKN